MLHDGLKRILLSVFLLVLVLDFSFSYLDFGLVTLTVAALNPSLTHTHTLTHTRILTNILTRTLSLSRQPEGRLCQEQEKLQCFYINEKFN